MPLIDPTPLIAKAPVIPVLTVDRAADAAPLARALVAGGLPVIEVTLRTRAALDAVHAIAGEVPDCAGGVAWLKAVAAPLPGIKFCPTGGIDMRNAGAYLALANVISVGGSWPAPKELIAAHDFARITALAKEAAALRAATGKQ